MKARSFLYISLFGTTMAFTSVVSQAVSVFNGHEYDIVTTTFPITWDGANAATLALGGGWHLATITSQEENDFIAGEFPSAVSNGHWLGGIQTPAGPVDEPDGAWNWVTGEPWAYTNWASIEPNDAGGGETRLHFDVFSDGGGTWNDLSETSERFGYVIERERGEGVPDGGATLLLFLCSIGSISLLRRALC